MQSKKVGLPRELAGIIKEASGAAQGQSVEQQYQVGSDPCRLCGLSEGADPPAIPDDPEEAGARGGELPAGLRRENELDNLRACQAFSSGPRGEVWYHPGVTGPVLSFDIETTGLKSDAAVTCACAWDPDSGVDYRECTPTGAPLRRFMELLDSAPLLCAFNGVRFDLPFLAKRWNVPADRVGRWVAKLVDPFEACRQALGKTFSLDKALCANGIACKTGSGAEAVVMARQRKWAELMEYCMADTKKTRELVKLERVLLPI